MRMLVLFFALTAPAHAAEWKGFDDPGIQKMLIFHVIKAFPLCSM